MNVKITDLIPQKVGNARIKVATLYVCDIMQVFLLDTFSPFPQILASLRKWEASQYLLFSMVSFWLYMFLTYLPYQIIIEIIAHLVIGQSLILMVISVLECHSTEVLSSMHPYEIR